MKPHVLILPALFVLASCGNDEGEPAHKKEEETASTQVVEPKIADPDPEPAPEPEPQTGDDRLDALLSALKSDENSSVMGLDDLPEDQRRTLEEAIDKAVANLDLDLLTTALGANLGDLVGLDGSSSTVKVLSPEEAKEMGIDLENLKVLGADSGTAVQSKVVSVRVFTPGSPEAATPEEAAIPDELGAATGAEIVETQQVNDPEMNARIQEYLEAGDSDALAGELTKMIQGGIDAVSLQQLIGQ